jgi:hypothetical protein
MVLRCRFAEGDDVPEALVLDRPNEPLSVSARVRARRRQAQQLYARGFEQGPEVRRIEGISVHDQAPEAVVNGPAAPSVRLRATCAIQAPSA